MADRAESTVSDRKYLELAFEYSKLKDKFKQLGLLGQRIIGEKESAVADAVLIDRQLRQANQENESLKFHNNQLSVRINVLQDELKVLQQLIDVDQRDAVRASRVLSTATSSTMESGGGHTSKNTASDLNDGINTFVEVTKHQVASMASENEQLVQTIQSMRSEFDVELTEKDNQIQLLKNRLSDFEKQSSTTNDGLVSSLYRKFYNDRNLSNRKPTINSVDATPNEIFPPSKAPNDGPENYSSLFNISTATNNIFDLHYTKLHFQMMPSRISLKKIKSSERIILSCLDSFVKAIHSVCNDISETIRNCSQSTARSGLQFYDFSTALSLVQMASSLVGEYEQLSSFNRNRFVLIYEVINKCCTSLEMIERLLEFHFNHSNTTASSYITNENKLKANPKLNLLFIIQKYLSIIGVSFKNLLKQNSPLIHTPENNHNHTIFIEIQNVLRHFIDYLNGTLNSVVIENNIDSTTITSKEGCMEVAEVGSHNIISTSSQQLYITLNSLLKTRATHMIDVANMFLLVVENEQEMLQDYGWFSSHMTSLTQLSHSNNHAGSNDATLCAFEKITHFMNAANTQLKTAHLIAIDRLTPSVQITASNDASEVSDHSNTYCIKSLKENYMHLQHQLMTTIKKLDEVTNTNELLQFKLKTSNPLEHTLQAPNCSSNSYSYVASNQILPTNQVLDELKDYVQQKISMYQGEHRKILSHICVLLSDWQAMKYRLEECQKDLKFTTNEVTRYKNEHASLSTHLLSMKESYEKNVVELTEKLSLSTAAHTSHKTRK